MKPLYVVTIALLGFFIGFTGFMLVWMLYGAVNDAQHARPLPEEIPTPQAVCRTCGVGCHCPACHCKLGSRTEECVQEAEAARLVEEAIRDN